ncbi:ACS family hexuronate transporter-like MFS transporter [Sphingomonas sp. PP-F2F-G114-C0414]|uniref:MFS transporter n=1 Tax=Sphingomonas sp. PP-F2F-G114-C0414 TaxID=2135662 RepID=UPI000EF880AB|nr:MFS transporter [Sphingomonas sp. PP-F2F-G114-C0414]RMB37458.1 ACS family hexuronate transporter-like MFS transporter [Sphingomonas sp. PP-F2F-G114-C0414]
MSTDRRRWIIVALVFVAIMLNYVDRQILSLLKPTLEAEFHWSDQDYANMLSAFQVAAAVAFLGTGWFIDRVGLKLGFALGVAVWSLAGMAHAVVSSVGGFIAARVVLGGAESIGTPAAVKSAATYFTQRERSIALGIGNTAPNIGAVITPLVVPALAVAYGWRAAFLAAGALGLVWVVVWFSVRIPAVAESSVRPAPIRWSDLFKRRETAAIAIAKVLSDQVWFFMLAWLPDLFHRMFGLPQGTVGLPVALAYAMAAAGALTGGWLPTRLMARGWSVDRARKGTMLLYALLVLPVTLVLVVDDAWSAALLLGLGLFAHQGFSTNVFALATDIVPARAVGSTIGIAAFCGNMWSIVLIQLAAVSLAAGYGYGPLLGVCSVSYLLALGLVQLIIPTIVAVPDDGSDVVAMAH